jgi:DnaJ-class molecular chaperone
MSIYSREQAFSILGIDNGSDDKRIREAYHELLKEYHPDNQPDDKTIYRYYSIVEAYDFLTKSQEDIYKAKERSSTVYRSESSQAENVCGNHDPNKNLKPRILGNSEALKENSIRKKAREERERYERANGNGREKRLREMLEEGKKLREKEEAERQKKESVDRALKSIKAILASRIIEEYLGDDTGDKEKNDK